MSESAWEKRSIRERRAREAAEALLEAKSLELYSANQETRAVNANLEERVRERVADLASANMKLREEMRERRRAEDSLRITQFVVDRCADAIYWIDPAANVVYANDAACRAVGYTRDELGEMSVFDIDIELAPDVWPDHWDELRRRGSLVMESTHCNRHGDEFPVEITANYIKMDGVEYNCVFARDIAERKAARVRNESMTELYGIVQHLTQQMLNSQDLSISINAILAEIGGFLGVSRSYLMRFREGAQIAYNTHEWTSGDIPSQADRFQDVPVSEFGWWIDRLSLGKPIVIADLGKAALPARIGNALRRYDTQAALSLPIIVNGALTGLLGFDQVGRVRQWLDEEVTLLLAIVESLARAIERQIAERAREQHRVELSEALRRETVANKSKSTFLANMSHEIRTPMTAILGYADMLVRPNRSIEEQQEWATQTRRNAEHLLGLLNDILDLSKIEAGELTISPELCSLADMMQDVVSVLQPLALEKMLLIRVSHASEVPRQLMIDPTRLRQILINLVHNAIKFTDYGTITIEAYVEQTNPNDPSVLAIAVRDTGVGIPDEKLEEIFRPFTQINQPQKHAGGGVGLGLTISRHLASMLGGKLAARNLDGNGSEFVLHLPQDVAVEDSSSASSDAYPKPARAAEVIPDNTHVLVVDDNPDNQRIIHFLLNEIGVQVTPAKHGREAVQLVLNPPHHMKFDAVLMDIQMPVMDGYTATATMRQQGVTVPIIALTAHAMSEDKNRCLEAGCDDYVSKPIIPESLYRSLAKHLSQLPASEIMARGSTQAPAVDRLVSSMIGNERFAPLLEAYLVSLASTREMLAQHLVEQDWESIQALSHRLRGTAANHGFPQITEAAGVCEDLIREQASRLRVREQLQKLMALLRAATVPPQEIVPKI